MMKSKKRAGGGDRGRSRFSYKPPSAEAVRKRAEQQGGQFDSIWRDGIDRWRPRDGENVIRILPPTWDDHDHYGYDIWVHGFVGPDKSTYLCPQKMQDEPCPICKATREAKAAGEEEDAKQLAARRQVAVWILDRDDDTQTPKLFTMSWSMDRDIAALCHNKRTGKVLLIDHPDEGYDISFTRTGKGLNTRYIGMAVDRDPSPIADEDDQERILEYIQENPIPSLLNFYDAARLEGVVEGGTDERDEDLDDADGDADARSPKPSKPSKRSARRQDPEEEPDEDAEEDEDVRPPRTKPAERRGISRPAGRAKPAADSEEEPDEDYDDDDGEAADAPRKPARGPAKGKPPFEEDAEEDDSVDEGADAEEDDYYEDDEEADDAPPTTPRRPAREPARSPGKPAPRVPPRRPASRR